MNKGAFWAKVFRRPAPSGPKTPNPGNSSQSNETPTEVQSERPIGSASEDKLDRATFAGRVAGVLADRPSSDSIVIGLYGPWGDGKTSTLAMVKEALRRDPRVVIVEYNPWFFSSNTEALTKSFFLSLGEALEQSGFFSAENIGSLLAKYGGIIPKVGDVARRVGESLSVKELSSVRLDVERVLKKHRKRVVVFVDDIDRLDRKEIQTLFKLVRLSADFPFTSYVLAFDDRVVADALGEAYGDGDREAGRRFLEKIIQVPLNLPPASADTLRYLAFQACERVLNSNGIRLEERASYEFANNFTVGFGHALKTPRQVKLYENAITFALPILRGEVNIVDQMLIEGLRIFYPALYAFVRENSSRFLGERSDRQQRVEPGVLVKEALGADVSASEIRAIQNVVEHLFPRTSTMGYGNEWDSIWGKDQRICARGYFRRYFTYTVPAGELGDAAVQDFIAIAASQDATRLVEHWTAAHQKRAIKLLISKLRAQEETLPEGAIPGICLVVAAHAHEIMRSREPIMGDMDFRQAAILVAHLIKRTADRDQLVRAVLSSCRLPAFSIELLNWCLERESDGKIYGYMNVEQIRPFYELLWNRILEEGHDGGVIGGLGDDWQKVLIGLCHGGLTDEVRGYMRQLLDADDGTLASELIASMPGYAWLMESGVPVPSDFQRHNYDALALIAEPDEVLKKLKLRYGELEILEYSYLRDEDAADKPSIYARQFAYIHRHANADAEAQVDSGPSSHEN